MEDARGLSLARRDLVRHDLVHRVMLAVRSLGRATSLEDALQRIVDDVIQVLDFEVAAVSLRDADGRLYHRAVAGPAGVAELIGTSASVKQWRDLLAVCEARDGVQFFDHTLLSHPAALAIPQWWAEGGSTESAVDGWNLGDTLFAPLYDDGEALIGILSADLAPGSRHQVEQRTALALFAAEAGSSLLEWEARERAEQQRVAAERRLRIVWDSGLIAAAILDEFGTMTDVNEQAAHMLGYRPADLIGQSIKLVVPTRNADAAWGRFTALVDGMGSWVQERELVRRDGTIFWTSMHAATIAEGNPPRPTVIVQFTDITTQREHAALLVHQLDHDPLTDLPNRRVLETRLADLFGRRDPFGILYCDLDGFKSVLDGLGHAAADEVLVQVATRLRSLMPDNALLVRLSGDWFAVLVDGTDDVDELVDLATVLSTSLAAPFEADGVSTALQMSVGVSSSRAWHSHPIDVLREADEARDMAKRRGRARIEVFDPGRDRPVTRADLELELDLRIAIDEREGLEPHFQSVISLTSGAVVGYESLLRWRHPRLGVLLPERFISVADRAGLGAALGWRVLELVRESVPPQLTAAATRPWIAVNVAAAQLGRGTLLDALRAVIDTTFRDQPSELHLEITETSLLDASPAVIDELYAAVELGARLSLDDFGTGYSSLTLLRDLPVTSIKIDRSFIAPIAVDIRARTIVQHTIELCQGLGMSTIAEGIETHEQLAWLQTLGCEFGQGFLIDRPTPWPRIGSIPADASGLAGLTGAVDPLDVPPDREPRRFGE